VQNGPHQRHGDVFLLQRYEHKYHIPAESIDPMVFYAAESAGRELTLKTIAEYKGLKPKGLGSGLHGGQTEVRLRTRLKGVLAGSAGVPPAGL
jgi:hypothetical protein